jgi:hypothetical protein
LRRLAVNTNEGANERLILRRSGPNRPVVAFDLTGVTRSSVTKATLVLTVAKNFGNWGSAGGLVEVHPLLEDFTEGNGKILGLPLAQQTRGTGDGVTWACATDTNIANLKTDCSPSWKGGSFGPATDSVLHTNATTGEVSFDVTADVVAGDSAWLIKKAEENTPGRANYYSREGAATAGKPEFAPKLVLEEEGCASTIPQAGSCDPNATAQCCSSGLKCTTFAPNFIFCAAPSGAPCDINHPEGCQSGTCETNSPSPGFHCV